MTGETCFQYLLPRVRRAPSALNRLPEIGPLKDPHPLTGRVQGQAASDLEERFARALSRTDLGYQFQVRVRTVGGVPGQEKRIDFIVEDGPGCPVEIDGPFAHHTAAQQGADLVREILLNEALRRRGMLPIRRVKWWQLETQALANRLVTEIFGGGR